jgi:hypothetical protein
VFKKIKEIPKGDSESVNLRKTDNTMTKRKRTKRRNNDLQNTTQKTKNWTSRIPLKSWGWTQVLCSSCSTRSHLRVIIVTNLAISHMNEERTGLWIRQTEHIRGNLWHRYSVMLNQPRRKYSIWQNNVLRQLWGNADSKHEKKTLMT